MMISGVNQSPEIGRVAQPVLLLVFCTILGLVVASKICPTSDEARFMNRRHEMEQLVSIIGSNPAISIVRRHAQSKHLLLATDHSGRPIPLATLGQSTAQLLRLFEIA